MPHHRKGLKVESDKHTTVFEELFSVCRSSSGHDASDAASSLDQKSCRGRFTRSQGFCLSFEFRRARSPSPSAACFPPQRTRTMRSCYYIAGSPAVLPRGCLIGRPVPEACHASVFSRNHSTVSSRCAPSLKCRKWTSAVIADAECPCRHLPGPRLCARPAKLRAAWSRHLYKPPRLCLSRKGGF